MDPSMKLSLENLQLKDLRCLSKILLSASHLEWITFYECTFDLVQELNIVSKSVMHTNMIIFNQWELVGESKQTLIQCIQQNSALDHKIDIEFIGDFFKALFG